jgi:hypothetical protein
MYFLLWGWYYLVPMSQKKIDKKEKQHNKLQYNNLSIDDRNPWLEPLWIDPQRWRKTMKDLDNPHDFTCKPL